MQQPDVTGGQPGSGWRVEVLGVARVVGPAAPASGVPGPAPGGTPTAGGLVSPLDRKEGALLAYLALEGDSARAQVAELLWPESGEQARNNLRQMLRRLKLALGGAELVGGRDALSLLPGVVADAAALQMHVFHGRNAAALALDGVLLSTFAYDDLPDFHDWLTRTREGLTQAWRRAAAAEVERLEAQGALTGALSVAERLLLREPTSEDAYRRLMRLHYLKGDRSAALGLYAQCREVLRRELSVTPLPETEALARDIERGAQVGGGSGAGARGRGGAAGGPLPASVLRPPVLAGRERAWAQLEAAWEKGQLIFVHGAPGQGKTRLVTDFVASKGAAQWFPARPGDRNVPFATTTRCVQSVLAQRPDLPLPSWVREEVRRLLPQFEPDLPRPPPMLGEEARLRFCQAITELLSTGTRGLAALVFDDFQFADAGSVSVGEYMFSTMFPLGEGMPHTLVSFRTGELTAENTEVLRRLEDAGVAAIIELPPLGEGEVGALLDGLGLPGLEGLEAPLFRYTGGNPLYLTETVKHLLETGALGRGWPERLPPPGKVAALIQQRLARVSRHALSLAQVAALAGTHFSLELGAEVLELRTLEVQGALEELERVQVLRGAAFTHDLVFESVLAAIPKPVRTMLHGRLAAALETRRAPAAVVAQHWLAAGAGERAVPALEAAARAAEDTLRLTEAAALRAHAEALRAPPAAGGLASGA